jgi:hypothetical protein
VTKQAEEKKLSPWNLYRLNYTTARLLQHCCAKNLLWERLISHLFRKPGSKGARYRGLGGTIFSGMYGTTLRSCIYVRNHINILPLLQFCSRDVATVRILYSSEGNHRELIVISAYLPYDLDEPPPSKELTEVIDYCSTSRKQLIIGCDANSHHILLGSMDINPRGESLVEFLVSSNLNILNWGNEPAFVISNRREVIDLTPWTDWI